MDLELKKQQVVEKIAFLGKIDISIGKRLLEIKKEIGLDYFSV